MYVKIYIFFYENANKFVCAFEDKTRAILMIIHQNLSSFVSF